MKTFTYRVEGSDGTGNHYVIEGEVQGTSVFLVANDVGSEAFEKITEGKAVFGKPGQGGCRVQMIEKVVIEVKKEKP